MCKEMDTIIAQRGMVFYANLGEDNDNKGGTMMSKTRPCIIFSRDKDYNNTNPRRYTVIPISSRDGAFIFSLTEVLFLYKGAYNVAVTDSICPLSIFDLKNYLYTINSEVMDKIEKAVKVHCGFADPNILDITDADVTDYHEYKLAKDIELKEDEEKRKNAKYETNQIENKISSNPANSYKPIDSSSFVKKPVTSVYHNNNSHIKATVTNITDRSDTKVFVTYKKLNQAELRLLKNKSQKDWTDEECVSFMRAFAEYNNNEVAAILGIKIKNLYQLKYTINKRVNDNRLVAAIN